MAKLFELAELFDGQPVGLVAYAEGGYEVGVLNILNPEDADWCLKPVKPEDFTAKDAGL